MSEANPNNWLINRVSVGVRSLPQPTALTDIATFHREFLRMIAYARRPIPALAPLAADSFRQSVVCTPRDVRNRGRNLAHHLAVGIDCYGGESSIAVRRCDVAEEYLDRREYLPLTCRIHVEQRNRTYIRRRA